MRTIRPSALFETRRRTALRGEGFAWVPDLWSFLKLQEVGFSPYLSFYSHLNVLLMFRLNEAVRDHLIGPKTLDRIDKIFGRRMEQPVTAPRLFRGCLGVGWFNLCIKWLFGMHWAGNGRGFRVH